MTLALWNCHNRKKLKAEKSEHVEPKLTLSQYHGIGALMAVGVSGTLGYYVY